VKSKKLLGYLVYTLVFLTPYSFGASELRILPKIDHSAWSELLSDYVNTLGLVDYGRWKSNHLDLAKLDRYLDQFKAEADPYAKGLGLAVSLVNAYNAFTVQWILDNYPTESIRELKNSWTGKRYSIGGKLLSLDNIENNHLRPLIGWQVHALIVCAARSCPPLRNSAYSEVRFEAEIEEAYRNWLSRSDLTKFNIPAGKVELPMIFKWFAEDYEHGSSVDEILRNYSPESYREFVESGSYKIVYKKYHWGLNDQSELGKFYK
tara:strand:+ start:5521 stop:6309 length:789 start_codon:yes stop_codon:yes gene_type:complete